MPHKVASSSRGFERYTLWGGFGKKIESVRTVQDETHPSMHLK